MSKFEDHLWREFVREHGDPLAEMSIPTAKHIWRGPRLVAGTGLGLAGVGAAVALVLGATTTSPAFAVTRNHDGTVTISIQRASGIAGANAKLHQLAIRARVMQHVPAGYRCTSTVAQQGQGAPAESSSSSSSSSAPEGSIANAHWTIDPRKIPAAQTLALTPPPPPPGANSGNSGNSGRMYSCGTEGPGPGGPPPAPPGGNGGNSGNSGNSSDS